MNHFVPTAAQKNANTTSQLIFKNMTGIPQKNTVNTMYNGHPETLTDGNSNILTQTSVTTKNIMNSQDKCYQHTTRMVLSECVYVVDSMRVVGKSECTGTNTCSILLGF